MSGVQKVRHALKNVPALAVLMFALSCAVFGWGLHYKLSLYDAPTSASPHEFAAKLLSNEERAATRAQSAVQIDEELVPVVFIAYFLATLTPRLSGVSSHVCVRSHVPFHEIGLVGSLFRRPPPVAFHLA